ncbi:MAG: carbamoyl phosphate synthase large subunit, partial [Candidatus Limnocylindrus sp.]
PFDKFPGADRLLGSQMKATGEVMAIDRTFGAALNKALRSMEQKGSGPTAEEVSWEGELATIAAHGGAGLKEFLRPSDSRLWRLLAAMRRGVSEEEIHAATGITRWFLAEFARLISIEHRVRDAGRTLIGPDPSSISLLATAKRSAIGDEDLARISGL